MKKGDFSTNDVHKQFGICLRTPPYVNRDITEPVLCALYLYRPKEKEMSDPVNFWYTPSQQVRYHESLLLSCWVTLLTYFCYQLLDMKTLNLAAMPVKPVMKRGRAPKVNQDDPSSG